MNLFQFEDYRDFLKARIQAMPKQGRGQSLKIAEALKMHTSRFSRILRGAENLTLEQASDLAVHLGLSDFETEYFFVLVNHARAGTPSLRRTLEAQRKKLRTQADRIDKRLSTDREFSEAEQSVFYSEWHYSAIRLLTSIEGYGDVDSISERLRLPRTVATRALAFLVSTGLCLKEGGRYRMGPSKTHLPPDSPMIARLHSNWRLRSIEHLPRLSLREFALTAPMSIPKEDFARIREILVETAERAIKIAGEANEPTTLACLNIDWFEL